jgi:hypothetical protein
VHARHLRQPTALAPAFPAGGAGHAGDDNAGIHGVVEDAPGSGLIRWQGGQVGKIGAAALAHATSCRARQSVKADGSELLAADPAISRFHAHSLHICATSRPFNGRLSATAAGTFPHCRSHFCEQALLLDASRSPGQSLELS